MYLKIFFKKGLVFILNLCKDRCQDTCKVEKVEKILDYKYFFRNAM